MMCWFRGCGLGRTVVLCGRFLIAMSTLDDPDRGMLEAGRRKLRANPPPVPDAAGVTVPPAIFSGGVIRISALRRQPVEIGQAGQAELAGAMYSGVAGERWVEAEGLVGIGADRFGAGSRSRHGPVPANCTQSASGPGVCGPSAAAIQERRRIEALGISSLRNNT